MMQAQIAKSVQCSPLVCGLWSVVKTGSFRSEGERIRQQNTSWHKTTGLDIQVPCRGPGVLPRGFPEVWRGAALK